MAYKVTADLNRLNFPALKHVALFPLLENRVSSYGDFAPKWRFQKPSGARNLVAIRRPKSGDFGMFVNKYQKVAFSGQNLAIFWDFFSP